MKKITYTVYSAEEFNTLVNDNIPSAKGEYDFVVNEEINEDDIRSYENVTPSVSVRNRSDIEGGALMWNAHQILCYLCEAKVIPPGDYLVGD
jgi:hypothetical protein